MIEINGKKYTKWEAWQWISGTILAVIVGAAAFIFGAALLVGIWHCGLVVLFGWLNDASV